MKGCISDETKRINSQTATNNRKINIQLSIAFAYAVTMQNIKWDVSLRAEKNPYKENYKKNYSKKKYL